MNTQRLSKLSSLFALNEQLRVEPSKAQLIAAFTHLCDSLPIETMSSILFSGLFKEMEKIPSKVLKDTTFHVGKGNTETKLVHFFSLSREVVSTDLFGYLRKKEMANIISKVSHEFFHGASLSLQPFHAKSSSSANPYTSPILKAVFIGKVLPKMRGHLEEMTGTCALSK